MVTETEKAALYIPFNGRPNVAKCPNLTKGRISISLGYYISKYLARAGDNIRLGVGINKNHDIIEKLPQPQLTGCGDAGRWGRR
jgi:hypothetical protein